jgi:hypothetical protein
MSAEDGRYTLQQAIPAFPFPLPQVPATGIRRGIRLFPTESSIRRENRSIRNIRW